MKRFSNFYRLKILCVLVLFHMGIPSGHDHIESKVHFCLRGGQHSCRHIVRRFSMSCTDFIKNITLRLRPKEEIKSVVLGEHSGQEIGPHLTFTS